MTMVTEGGTPFLPSPDYAEQSLAGGGDAATREIANHAAEAVEQSCAQGVAASPRLSPTPPGFDPDNAGQQPRLPSGPVLPRIGQQRVPSDQTQVGRHPARV